jgi:hypothetical protein
MNLLDAIKNLNDDDLYKVAELYDNDKKSELEKELDIESLNDTEWASLSEQLAKEIESRQDNFVPTETTGDKDYTKPESWYWFSYNQADLRKFDEMSSDSFMKKFEIEDIDVYIAAKTSLKLAIDHYDAANESRSGK